MSEEKGVMQGALDILGEDGQVTFTPTEFKDWFNLPLTQAYFKCLVIEEFVLRKSLFDGQIGLPDNHAGYIESVAASYLGVVNRADTLAFARGCNDILDKYKFIEDEHGDEE